MRILLISNTYRPSTNGVAIQVALIKNGLEKLGHHVLVLAPKNRRVKYKEAGVLRFPSVNNPLVPSDYPIGIPLISAQKIEKFDPQVIHVHHPVLIKRLSIALAKKMDVPLFFNHNSSYEQVAGQYLPVGSNLVRKLTRNNIKDFSKKVTCNVSPSTKVTNHLKKIGVNNVVTIPYGIEVDKYETNKKKNTFLSLVFVGRLEKEKSVEKLIELGKALLTKTGQFRLMIVGTGLRLNSLRKLVAEYGLGKQVKFVGLVKNESLPKLLSVNHFFVSYSEAETFSVSHLEALASGVPLIIPPKVELGDFVSCTNSLLVKSDYNRAADKIYEAYLDKKKMKGYFASSKKTAKAFSIEKKCKSLVRLYQKFI